MIYMDHDDECGSRYTHARERTEDEMLASLAVFKCGLRLLFIAAVLVPLLLHGEPDLLDAIIQRIGQFD